MSDATQGKRFYGWAIVGITFAAQFVATGWVFYALPMVLVPMAEEFSGGDRTPISTLLPIAGFAGMGIGLVIGRLVGRGYVRSVMMLGALGLGLGYLVIAHAETLLQVQLVFGSSVAFGLSALASLTCTPLVANWFESRRAWALGLSQLGASLGGAVMAPVVGLMLARYDWRTVFEVLGVSALGLVPALWLLVVDRPEDRGLQPLGAEGSDVDTAPIAVAPMGEILRDRNVWLIGLVVGLGFLATGSVTQHIAAYGRDLGFDLGETGVLATILSGAAAAGKLVFGRLCDRLGEHGAFAISCVGHAMGLLLLSWLSGWALVAGACALVGLSFGGLLPVSSSLMARVFGREQVGPKMGVALPLTSAVQLPGPIVMARIFDETGSYDLGFYGLAVLLLAAAFMVRWVRVLPQGRV